MLAVVDYGVGNLFSLRASLSALGAEVLITSDIESLRSADRLILPGVGAFGDASDKLIHTGLGNAVREFAGTGKPVLGICLGMQLLFDESSEYGFHRGLGLIKGCVRPLADDITSGLKIPQMGWNSLNFVRTDPILKYSAQGDYVYYVHSYYAKNCTASLVAVSEYEVAVPGIVRNENVCGTQFHPEKSGAAGMNILRAFLEL